MSRDNYDKAVTAVANAAVVDTRDPASTNLNLFAIAASLLAVAEKLEAQNRVLRYNHR